LLNLGTVVGAATNLLINVDNHTNDILSSATGLPQVETQTDSRFDYAYKASISDSSDVDDYLVKAPAPPSGTQNVMTVMVWALQNGGLDPKALLYDALGNPVAANVLSHENNTWVLQVPNAAANAAYYVSVSAADPSGTHSIGNYFLGVDFSTVATNLQSLVSNGPSSGATSATPSLAFTANADLLFHFVLSVDGSNAPAGAAVQMSIYDQNGQLTNTLIVNAGDSRSLTLFLAKGSYTFRFNFINRNGGPVTPLLYRLAGIDLSDPVNPYPSDPTSDPAGSSGTPPSGSGSTVTAPSQPPDGSYGTSTF